MFDRLISEKNYNNLANDEKVSAIDPDSPEYAEIQFLFNTIFNECSPRTNANDNNIYEIEKPYSLKNQYISLNFEKRELNDISSYGWYESENYDDKKLIEQVVRLRNKGLEKLKDEIKVSSPINKEPERYIIVICKFIVGRSEVIFQDQELTEEDKAQYRKNYDTVVRILSKSNNKENIKNYNILREENIELLYLIKAKKVEFKSQIIECSNQSCPNNELNNESNKKESSADKNMYFCLLKENYFCNVCHNELHQKEILYGAFDPSRCELKTCVNLQGECPNKDFHPNKKNFDIDYFCTDCLKGICSYCKVYGNEKHPELQIITDLFNKSKLKEKEKNVHDKIIGQLNSKISGQQNKNKSTGSNLRTFLKNHFKQLYDILDEKFTEEGEKLVSICYQLNFLKENLIFYHRAYLNKENLCLNNNLKQELFWTKKTHLEHLLYLIGIKDNIKTKYKVDIGEFEKIINKYKSEIDNRINQEYGVVKSVETVKKEKKDSLITFENLMEIAKLPQSD